MKRLLPIALLALTGCVQLQNKQVSVKSTVFGFQVSASPTGGVIPSVQFGLIRNTYFSNPTGTNEVHAAPYASETLGDLTPTHQTASESISTK